MNERRAAYPPPRSPLTMRVYGAGYSSMLQNLNFVAYSGVICFYIIFSLFSVRNSDCSAFRFPTSNSLSLLTSFLSFSSRT